MSHLKVKMYVANFDGHFSLICVAPTRVWNNILWWPITAYFRVIPSSHTINTSINDG